MIGSDNIFKLDPAIPRRGWSWQDFATIGGSRRAPGVDGGPGMKCWHAGVRVSWDSGPWEMECRRIMPLLVT